MLCIVILPAAVKTANIISRKPAGFHITFRKENITPGKARNITIVHRYGEHRILLPRPVYHPFSDRKKKKAVRILHCLLPYYAPLNGVLFAFSLVNFTKFNEII